MRQSARTKARYLRKMSSPAEKILWRELRNKKLGARFRRQHPIEMYILDFYAPEAKLAIELDSVTHGIKENLEYDQDRTGYLNEKGIKVLRFWNAEVEKNLNVVLKKIRKELFG